MKTGGDKTKQRVLLEALRLFTTKQYDKVTYRDLENATGLSRGAIIYHIKNKETLFRDVVELFVFENNTLTSLDETQRATLRDTILNFTEQLSREQEYWRESGIASINFALVNIQMSSYTLFPESLAFAKEWYDKEVAIWRDVMEKAAAAGEIRRVDPQIFAELFEDAYLGAAYAGLPERDGYDVERVRHKLLSLYEAIRD